MVTTCICAPYVLCIVLSFVSTLPFRLHLFIVCERLRVYAEQLQRDLSALQHWEHLWQMEFHPQKCTVIHVSNKRQPRKTGYTLHGHTLEEVDSAKYLGVTIHHKHIFNIRTKANRTLGFIKPNLNGCKPQIKSMAYQTLVRPTLEYASTVWDPHHQVHIRALEGIQRRAARFVTNN